MFEYKFEGIRLLAFTAAVVVAVCPSHFGCHLGAPAPDVQGPTPASQVLPYRNAAADRLQE
jgi:hypothetical protein